MVKMFLNRILKKKINKKNIDISELSKVEDVVNYCLTKKRDLTLAELNIALGKLCAVSSYSSYSSQDIYLLIKFFNNFKFDLTSSQIDIVCEILKAECTDPMDIYMFIAEENKNIIGSNNLVLFLKKFINMNAFSFFFLELKRVFYKLNNEEKKEMFKMIQNNINECNMTPFEEFIIEKFDPSNKYFIDTINIYFCSENKQDLIVQNILNHLIEFFDVEEVRQLVLGNVEDDNLNSMEVLEKFINVLKDNDIKFILWHMLNLELSPVKEAIKFVIKNRCSIELLEEIISITLTFDIKEKLSILSLIIPLINERQYMKLKDNIMTSNKNIENVYNLYKIVKDTDFDKTDLIDLIKNSNDAKIIYLTCLETKDITILNELKKALIKTGNDYYIGLYGIEINQSILIEYYEDASLILKVVFALQKEKEISEELKNEIHIKKLEMIIKGE